MYDFNKEINIVERLQLLVTVSDDEFNLHPEFYLKESEKLLADAKEMINLRQRLLSGKDVKDAV